MKKTILVGVIACTFHSAWADELPAFDLGTLVVTPQRFSIKPAESPFNTIVVNANDISHSPARSLPELLAEQAGIHIFNTTGTPDFSIDMRSFGKTGDQNTLVLLDGQRLNDLDLSAVKWSAIPLDAIERIEIMRGSGSTLYGDNATGGTINIITKAPKNGFSANAEAGIGSYESWNISASLNAGGEGKGFRLSANQFHSDGYRANNQNDQKSISGQFSADAGNGNVFLKFGATNQDLRLPGNRTVNPTTPKDELVTDRRGTSTPNDFATYDAWHASMGTAQKYGTSEFNGEITARSKDQTIFSSSYTASRLNSLSATPRIKLPFQLAGHQHNLVMGVDLAKWDYLTRTANTPQTLSSPTSHTTGEQTSSALYLQDTIKFRPGLLLTIGGRKQRIENNLSDVLTQGSSQTQTRSVSAYEIGFRHEVGEGLAYFGKLGRSFRLPVMDELVSYGTIALLEPQTSQDREIGLEWKQQHHSLRATAFQIDLNNELHYNALTFTNSNLSPTRRYGIELEDKWRATPTLEFGGNYTYAVAKFRQGVYSGTNVAGKDIPLTPHHLATLTTSWQLASHTRLNGVLNYVGAQRYDNDQSNNFPFKMPAYTTLNIKLVHKIKDWTLDATLNNAFNEKYYSYAVSGSATNRNYNAYPMPERNLWFNAAYAFK